MFTVDVKQQCNINNNIPDGFKKVKSLYILCAGFSQEVLVHILAVSAILTQPLREQTFNLLFAVLDNKIL